MSNLVRMKQKANGFFREAEGLAVGPGREPLRERLGDALRRLDAERLYVVVCGEWRRGKSSFINAYLEEPDLCPVGQDVTTAVVTVIQYAEVPRYLVFVGEPGQEETIVIERGQIPLYVSEKHNPGDAKRARLLLIELPNPRLKEGLILVDTPGVGGALARHTDITYAFVPKADAVLFVTDPSAMTVPELEFVKLIDRHCKNVVFVVTKMDGDAGHKAAPVIADNSAKIASTLGLAPGSITMIPVSSSTRNDYRESRDERDLADSGFPKLELVLWNHLLRNRGRVTLMSALVKLDRILGDLGDPVAAELIAVSERDQAKLEALKTESEQAIQILGKLQGNSATWKGQLTDGLAEVRKRADRALSAGFREIRRQSDGYLQKDNYLQSPEQIPTMLETDIDALLADLQDLMERGAAKLHADLVSSTGLNLERSEVDELTFDSPEFTFDPTGVERAGVWQKAQTVGREIMFNAGGGATIGGLLGGIAGGLLGLIGGPLGVLGGAQAGAAFGAGLGLIGGKAFGLKNSLKKVQETDRQSVTLKLKPALKYFLEDCETAATHTLSDAQAKLAIAMKQELNQRISDEKARADEMLARIKEARARSAEENASRIPALKAEVSRIAAVRRQVTTLAAEVLRSVPDAPSEAPTPRASNRLEKAAPEPEVIATPVGAESDSGDWADA